jgi:hypothetical protein
MRQSGTDEYSTRCFEDRHPDDADGRRRLALPAPAAVRSHGREISVGGGPHYSRMTSRALLAHARPGSLHSARRK